MNEILFGWLAPNGIFYPCEFMEHESKAEELLEFYYGETEVNYRPEEALYREGFVKFTRDYAFLMSEIKDMTLTNKQVAFLKDKTLTESQKHDISMILDISDLRGHVEMGDENLKPYTSPKKEPKIIEYEEPELWIKIIAHVPVSAEVRPVIGNTYRAIRFVDKGRNSKLYFIGVNGEEVGVFQDRECVVVDKENEQ